MSNTLFYMFHLKYKNETLKLLYKQEARAQQGHIVQRKKDITHTY